MQIEFDPEKDDINRAKHGLSLARAAELEPDALLTAPVDRRQDYGEPRFSAYAMLDDRLHFVAFTTRGPVYRIISLRRANRRERLRYGPA